MSGLLALETFVPGELFTEAFTAETDLTQFFGGRRTKSMEDTMIDFIRKYENHPAVLKALKKLTDNLDNIRHRYETAAQRILKNLQEKAYHKDRITPADRRIIQDVQPHFRRSYASRLSEYLLTTSPNEGHFYQLVKHTHILQRMDPIGFQRFAPLLRRAYIDHLPDAAYTKTIPQFIKSLPTNEEGIEFCKLSFGSQLDELGITGKPLGKGSRFTLFRGPVKQRPPAEYYYFFPKSDRTLSRTTEILSRQASSLRATSGGSLSQTGGAATGGGIARPISTTAASQATGGAGGSSGSSWANIAAREPLSTTVTPLEDLIAPQMSAPLNLTGGAGGGAAEELTTGVQDLSVSDKPLQKQMSWAERLKKGS